MMALFYIFLQRSIHTGWRRWHCWFSSIFIYTLRFLRPLKWRWLEWNICPLWHFCFFVISNLRFRICTSEQIRNWIVSQWAWNVYRNRCSCINYLRPNIRDKRDSLFDSLKKRKQKSWIYMWHHHPYLWFTYVSEDGERWSQDMDFVRDRLLVFGVGTISLLLWNAIELEKIHLNNLHIFIFIPYGHNYHTEFLHCGKQHLSNVQPTHTYIYTDTLVSKTYSTCHEWRLDSLELHKKKNKKNLQIGAIFGAKSDIIKLFFQKDLNSLIGIFYVLCYCWCMSFQLCVKWSAPLVASHTHLRPQYNYIDSAHTNSHNICQSRRFALRRDRNSRREFYVNWSIR